MIMTTKATRRMGLFTVLSRSRDRALGPALSSLFAKEVRLRSLFLHAPARDHRRSRAVSRSRDRALGPALSSLFAKEVRLRSLFLHAPARDHRRSRGVSRSLDCGLLPASSA